MSAKAPATPVPTTGWRNRITGSGEEAPGQLLANPAKWRIHPKAQQDALAGALDAVGWVQQVLVNRRTGFVVERGLTRQTGDGTQRHPASRNRICTVMVGSGMASAAMACPGRAYRIRGTQIPRRVCAPL